MFRSRRRAVVFPQADHARFAGAIALAWRERPQLPFDSFVRGVADHDRGYGGLDVDGSVTIDPWPLRLSELTGLVTAYDAAGYPERLVPVVVPFAVTPQ